MTALLFAWLAFAQEPNHCVDITAAFSLKVKAMRCNVSQIGPDHDVEAQLKKTNGAMDSDGRPIYREAFRVMRLAH